MKSDCYLRAVLTVIAAALVYLCVVFTPMPAVSAQAGQIVGAPRPGESTGPAEVVIVGWRMAAAMPVQVAGGQVSVTGRVQTEPTPNTLTRAVLIGWEDAAAAGQIQRLSERDNRALPVTIRPAK